MNPQLKAFLDTIAWAEIGPQILAESDDGYNVLAGSLPDMVITFSSYHRHPGILIDMDGRPGGLESTAAGRYQLLGRYWRPYCRQLGLKDFSPAAQDTIAIQLIKECRAIADIEVGRFEQAVRKCRSRWASLPGASYGQPEKTMVELRKVFVDAGGELGKVNN